MLLVSHWSIPLISLTGSVGLVSVIGPSDWSVRLVGLTSDWSVCRYVISQSH